MRTLLFLMAFAYSAYATAASLTIGNSCDFGNCGSGGSGFPAYSTTGGGSRGYVPDGTHDSTPSDYTDSGTDEEGTLYSVQFSKAGIVADLITNQELDPDNPDHWEPLVDTKIDVTGTCGPFKATIGEGFGLSYNSDHFYTFISVDGVSAIDATPTFGEPDGFWDVYYTAPAPGAVKKATHKVRLICEPKQSPPSPSPWLCKINFQIPENSPNNGRFYYQVFYEDGFDGEISRDPPECVKIKEPH